MKTTESDINMIGYFLLERGDIERWSSWDSRKDDIFSDYPELKLALDQKRAADNALERIARSIIAGFHSSESP